VSVSPIYEDESRRERIFCQDRSALSSSRRDWRLSVRPTTREVSAVQAIMGLSEWRRRPSRWPRPTGRRERCQIRRVPDRRIFGSLPGCYRRTTTSAVFMPRRPLTADFLCLAASPSSVAALPALDLKYNLFALPWKACCRGIVVIAVGVLGVRRR
jgi:hypothetical protein